jgi:hypothetical protein
MMMTCMRCGSTKRCRTVQTTTRRSKRPIFVERCAECLAATGAPTDFEDLGELVEGLLVGIGHAERRAIRWRPPRPGALRRRRSPMLHVRRAVAAAEELEPPTVRDPRTASPPDEPRGAPALFEALCASLDVLQGERLPCEIDVVVDPGSAGRIYRDPAMASRLVSPYVTKMPYRDGCVGVGTVRVGARRVRIYERIE